MKNIIVLEEGKIKMRGSYSELKHQGLDFNEILKKYERTKENDKKGDIFEDESDKSEEENEYRINVRENAPEINIQVDEFERSFKQDEPEIRINQSDSETNTEQDGPQINVEPHLPDINMKKDISKIKFDEDIPQIKIDQDISELNDNQNVPKIEVIEDEKNNENLDTKDENDFTALNFLSIPQINHADLVSSVNMSDLDESEDAMSASAISNPELQTGNDLVKKAKKKREIKIIVDEEKDEGNVPLSIWCSFFNYGLSFFGIFLIVFSGLALSFLHVIINYIVAIWTRKDKDDQQGSIYFDLFWICVVLITLTSMFRTGSIFLCLLYSSVNIHKKMVWKILRAPSAFFDANPIGRILTRFTKDTVILDYFLGLILNITCLTAFKIFGAYVIIIISVPWMAIPLAINFFVAYLIRKR